MSMIMEHEKELEGGAAAVGVDVGVGDLAEVEFWISLHSAALSGLTPAAIPYPGRLGVRARAIAVRVCEWSIG